MYNHVSKTHELFYQEGKKNHYVKVNSGYKFVKEKEMFVWTMPEINPAILYARITQDQEQC